jgi:hypothetical protein
MIVGLITLARKLRKCVFWSLLLLLKPETDSPAVLAAVAAQDASTSAATTSTAASSTSAIRCTEEQFTKALQFQVKCLKEKGFDKCISDANMDGSKTCDCYLSVVSCGKEFIPCNPVLLADQFKAAVDKCVMTTKCSIAQCDRMIAASSTLVASIPVLVLSALAAARLI